MKIFYDLNGSLYANITNKCPCACRFCLRNNGDSVGGNDSLWLEHEPTIDEIKSAFDEVDKSKYNEVVLSKLQNISRKSLISESESTLTVLYYLYILLLTLVQWKV